VAEAEEISGPEGDDGVIEDAGENAPDDGLAPAHAKTPAARPVSGENEPELKHLAKVFHGRITRINKVK
jgi:hypothetical protein